MWAWTPGPLELLWEEGSALRGPREGNCQAEAAGSHRDTQRCLRNSVGDYWAGCEGRTWGRAGRGGGHCEGLWPSGPFPYSSCWRLLLLARQTRP